MKEQEIISVLRELHRITGFRVSLHGADYSEISAYPKEKSEFCRAVHCIPGELSKCIACDREASRRALDMNDTYIYKCRYGMIEAVSPLYNFGILTGFLMMGQVIGNDSDAEALVHSLIKDTVESKTLEQGLKTIRRVDPEMVESFVRIMTICAQYLTLSNAITGEKVTVAGMAKQFILDHYTEKFGIREICDEVGCSKSTLISAFKREFGVTVNEYLTEHRLKEAKVMLRSGSRCIAQVATATGFSDQSYFSKVFSRRYGISPSEYAKQ